MDDELFGRQSAHNGARALYRMIGGVGCRSPKQVDFTGTQNVYLRNYQGSSRGVCIDVPKLFESVLSLTSCDEKLAKVGLPSE